MEWLTTSFKLFTQIAEQNISDVEKIHSKIRINRFLSFNMNLFVGIMIIICSTLIISFKSEWLVYLIPSLITFYILLYFLLKKVMGKPEALVKSYGLLFTVIIQIIAISFLLKSFISFKDDVSINAIVMIFFSCLMLSIFTYSFYFLLKEMSDTIIRYFFEKVRYIIELKLTNGEIITGDLLTITKKSDYIIKTAPNENEVLIKNLAILTLKITPLELLDS